MVYGVDYFFFFFIGFYGLLSLWSFWRGFRKMYKFFNRKRKPQLTLIQGGKKEEEGPYGKSR